MQRCLLNCVCCCSLKTLERVQMFITGSWLDKMWVFEIQNARQHLQRRSLPPGLNCGPPIMTGRKGDYKVAHRVQCHLLSKHLYVCVKLKQAICFILIRTSKGRWVDWIMVPYNVGKTKSALSRTGAVSHLWLFKLTKIKFLIQFLSHSSCISNNSCMQLAATYQMVQLKTMITEFSWRALL